MKQKIFIGMISCLVTLNSCFQMKSNSVSVSMNKVLTETNILPIAVIGSGPAGQMAAIYGARGGKKTYVIEGNRPGGLLMNTTEVENWPGENSIQGPQIIDKLRNQALHQGVVFIQDAIEMVDFSTWPYRLFTENGHEFLALTVVIATGSTPRRLHVPGEEEYWGSKVSSCAVCDAPFFKDLNVVVVGGGDAAVEEAIQLASHAKTVTILLRKGQMRAAQSMQDRLVAYRNITVKYNVEVQSIKGDGVKVTGVELLHHKTGKKLLFPTDGVFLAIGHTPNSELFKDVLEMDKAGYIVTQNNRQGTSQIGVYAAGDVVDNHYRQAASAAGSGVAAGLDAVQFLDMHGYTPTFEKQIMPRLVNLNPNEDDDQPISMIRKNSVADANTAIVEPINSHVEFDQFIAKPGLLVVNFFDPDCSSCIQMRSIIESTAKELKEEVQFAAVQVDEQKELVERFFIHKVPCLLVFKDGALIARYSDLLGHKELLLLLQKLLV